jgi:hypothetical protein
MRPSSASVRVNATANVEAPRPFGLDGLSSGQSASLLCCTMHPFWAELIASNVLRSSRLEDPHGR